MSDIQIFDIYDLWYELPWFIAYKNILISATLLCVVLAFALVWYYKRKKKATPYWQITLEKIGLLDKKDPKLFYFSLTTILKQYLQQRYKREVISKTDVEMVEYLESNRSLYGCATDLKNIFNETTNIKFSEFYSTNSHIQDHLDLSIKVIKDTMPKEGHHTGAS